MPDIFNAALSHLNLFSTLSHKPEGITFSDQQKGEEVILFARRDFITNVPWMVMAVVFALAPLVLPFLLTTSGISLAFLSGRAIFISIVFYYLVVVGFVLIKFITWFYGIGIATTKRIIDIDLYNVSYIKVAATGIQDITNVEYVQRGFFQSFFDYGNVLMTVEAASEKLVFEQIPRPAHVVNSFKGW